MAGREYRMRKRAEGLDATRERIVEATARAALRTGGGSHVLRSDRGARRDRRGDRLPPLPDARVAGRGLRRQCFATRFSRRRRKKAPAVFAGLETRQERLERLVAELDAFYDRGAVWLGHAARDRDRVPELERVPAARRGRRGSAGREAVGLGPRSQRELLAAALADVASMAIAESELDAPPAEFRRTMQTAARLCTCALPQPDESTAPTRPVIRNVVDSATHRHQPAPRRTSAPPVMHLAGRSAARR